MSAAERMSDERFKFFAAQVAGTVRGTALHLLETQELLAEARRAREMEMERLKDREFLAERLLKAEAENDEMRLAYADLKREYDEACEKWNNAGARADKAEAEAYSDRSALVSAKGQITKLKAENAALREAIENAPHQHGTEDKDWEDGCHIEGYHYSSVEGQPTWCHKPPCPGCTCWKAAALRGTEPQAAGEEKP